MVVMTLRLPAPATGQRPSRSRRERPAPRRAALGHTKSPPRTALGDREAGERGRQAQRGHPHAVPVFCRSSVLWRPGDSSPFAPGTSEGAGAVVALGKFDALHKGHRSLATQAAEVGSPWLMSFSGIAEVLGWPARLPVVAPPDRARVLGSWGGHCSGRGVREVCVPFADIRALPPEDFVRLLAKDMGVAGVVCGANYRFGYRAAGDAAALVELGGMYGMEVRVVDLVGASEPGVVGCVSSTRVREALAAGRMARAAQYLGRAHRLVVRRAGAVAGGWGAGAIELDLGGLEECLNQPPGEGEYRVRAALLPAGGAGEDEGGEAVALSEGVGDPCTLRVAGDGSMGLLLDRSLERGVRGDAYVAIDFATAG